jgi:type IV pilus assembly protein PilA
MSSAVARRRNPATAACRPARCCPVNDDEGFQPAEGYAAGAVGAVRIGRFDNGHCGVEAELTVPGSTSLDGKLLWLDYDGEQQHWTCSGEPDDTYLPLDCRG